MDLHNQSDIPHVPVEETSHWPQKDKPEEFNRILDAFLAEHVNRVCPLVTHCLQMKSTGACAGGGAPYSVDWQAQATVADGVNVMATWILAIGASRDPSLHVLTRPAGRPSSGSERNRAGSGA